MDHPSVAYSTVALAGRASDPRVGEAMLGLAAHLLERGRHVLAASGLGIDFGLLPVTLVPEAELAQGADLLVAADCCSYAYAGFHRDFIRGHTLAIGCPKLDNADAYREKLATILTENDIQSVTIAYMEVPCCAGLVKLVEAAVQDSGKPIPVKKTKIGIQGAIV
jgi:hypothetical protein